MPEESTNLLPPERQRVLSREYYLRLAVVASAFATALIVVAGILLTPTYIFLKSSESTKQARLASMTAALATSDSTAFAARLKELSDEAAILARLGDGPSVTQTINQVLTISRPGVSVIGIVYAPPAGKNPRTVSLSGTAATRTALRNYQIALQNAPHVSAADLPISAYAKDVDITFTITVAFSL